MGNRKMGRSTFFLSQSGECWCVCEREWDCKTISWCHAAIFSAAADVSLTDSIPVWFWCPDMWLALTPRWVERGREVMLTSVLDVVVGWWRCLLPSTPCLTAKGLHLSGSISRRSSSRHVTACSLLLPWQVLLLLSWLLLHLELQQLQCDGGLELRLRSVSMLSGAWMLSSKVLHPILHLHSVLPVHLQEVLLLLLLQLSFFFLFHFPNTRFSRNSNYLSHFCTGHAVKSLKL